MSILEHVEEVPPDPIFGLGALCKQDKCANKVDLTVGVYKNDCLESLTMRSIHEAEKKLLKTEQNKVYLPMGGSEEFVCVSRELLFGKAFAQAEKKRFVGLQTIGGTNALRIGGELLSKEVSKKLYVSDPTWPNHYGIFGACDMDIKKYPYYNKETHSVDFDRMLDALAKAPERSVVLLHAVCHNPTGCDLDERQWKELSAFMLKHKLIPFFDCAYQGFSRGIEEDMWAIRHFADQGHELFVAHSFSKFFGLYGERVGALHALVKDEGIAKRAYSAAQLITRISFSNPPRHGESLVTIIMRDETLKKMWEEELSSMRRRIENMRNELHDALELKFGKDKFGFLKNRSGLFSLLGITEEAADHLIKDHSVYLTKSGRINLTGLCSKNIPYVVDAIVKSVL